MEITPGTIAQYTTDGAYPRTSYFIVTETFTFTIKFHTVWIVREEYGTWVVERKTIQAEDDMFAHARPLDRFEANAILSYALSTAEEAKQRALADLHKAESLLDRLRDVESIAWNAQIAEESM